MSEAVGKVFARRLHPCAALALDIGTHFVGVAGTKDLHSTSPVPIKTYLHLYPTDPDYFPERMHNLIKAHKPELLIVGWPGSTSHICDFTVRFVDNLQKHGVKLPVLKQDEQFSTTEARRHLRGIDKSLEHHKEWLDQVAACVQLQRFAESLRSS